MRIFHLSTEDDNGRNLEIDFNEYNIMQLINILYKKRYNKNLGLKFAKIYIETGKGAKENLKKAFDIDPEIINDGYEDMKKILGEIH